MDRHVDICYTSKLHSRKIHDVRYSRKINEKIREKSSATKKYTLDILLRDVKANYEGVISAR